MMLHGDDYSDGDNDGAWWQFMVAEQGCMVIIMVIIVVVVMMVHGGGARLHGDGDYSCGHNSGGYNDGVW